MSYDSGISGKTEHCGAKKGLGAYGIKKNAKKYSKILRRKHDKHEIKKQLDAEQKGIE